MEGDLKMFQEDCCLDEVNEENGFNKNLDLNRNKKLPPIKPPNRPKNDCRENLRQWRRKKLLSGSKHSTSGKTSPGKDKPEGKKIKKDEPLPMKQRALPESFWQQPENMQTSSLAGSFYTVLPPLFSSETSNNEDITEIRPTTPPGEKSRGERTSRYMTAPPDTELLFSLFDKYENKIDERPIVKRGRPKKQPPTETQIQTTPSKREEDPCMVNSLSEKLFPQLSLGGNTPTNNAPKFAVLKLPSGGERTVELPAIQQETNYSAMLNELVSHM